MLILLVKLLKVKGQYVLDLNDKQSVWVSRDFHAHFLEKKRASISTQRKQYKDKQFDINEVA